MKPTKKLEKEILGVYHAYWNSYLLGDMKTFGDLLDDNCHIIGSTAFDVFDNRQSALAFYTATAAQVSGKAAFRNRKIVLLPAGDSTMVQEQCDFYFLSGSEWRFYGHTRLSTLLAKKEKVWKIIHQHGSLPDTRAQEGEQLGLEKITKENIELREAVKRRTVELEYKNRELEMETALEKVRAVAMAMMLPTDVLSICQVLFEALHSLGFSECRNTMINIHYDEKNYLLNYDYAVATAGTITNIPYNFHPVVNKQIGVTRNMPDAFYEFSLAGGELKEFRELRKRNGEQDDPRLDTTDTLYYYLYSIGTGSIGISTYHSIAGEKLELLKRFRNVFNLAYRRYTDIALAEEQAREAKIELALERVRARTMAMYHSNELAGTASLLFQQIKELGFELWSCGFCIWKENDCTELWMNNDSGGLLPPMMIPYKDEPTHRKIYEASLRGETVHEYVWEGEALEKHYIFLQTIPSVKNAIDILKESGLSLPARQCYYVGFFKHGYLLLISKAPAIAASDLTSRFAKVFDQTYTRFLDLQKAEAHAVQAAEDLIKLQREKKRAEDALTELRETQKQLIQSEKMASLGELTAGIAHEIQNPLNFVNNFSEVNTELIEELKGERQKAAALRNTQLEDELIVDIKQNMEKIAHHGKRADAIVKGMLQHSRATGIVKEPTDINALADEYIRLCYYGLRAKDKLFNAAINTDFDVSVEKINIIPQDIGRVVLNIMTNAFYAVNARKKMNARGYEPAVSVQTKKDNDKVELSIADNGAGIPQNIIDKIFQPFFTTKPTGQGTGLGLSLCYDIVKAHDGEIKVITKAGEGSTFIIQLPIV